MLELDFELTQLGCRSPALNHDFYEASFRSASLTWVFTALPLTAFPLFLSWLHTTSRATWLKAFKSLHEYLILNTLQAHSEKQALHFLCPTFTSQHWLRDVIFRKDLWNVNSLGFSSGIKLSRRKGGGSLCRLPCRIKLGYVLMALM